MGRRVGWVALVLVLWAQRAPGQVEIRQGTVKDVDAEHSVITIRSRGRDRDYTLTPRTRFSAAGKGLVPLDLKSARLRHGAHVQFQAVERGGKLVLLRLRLARTAGGDVHAEPSEAGARFVVRLPA